MSFSFFPKTLLKKKSKVSGLIEVKEWLGEKTLAVENMIQSGGIVKNVWQKALKKVKASPKKILVLGLGGGTVIQLIKSKWPEASLIGLELDLEIIKAGKEFFGLEQTENLVIVNGDAFEWTSEEKFDLILVDLYLGREFSVRAGGEKFLEKIKKLLTKKGMVIFNRLKTDETAGFEKRLREAFVEVAIVKTSTNHLFLVKVS